MKKGFIALLSVLLLISMVGCAKGNTKNDEYEDLLTKVQAQGYFTVGTEGTWAPWTYQDEQGNLVGFDVEVTKAIAEKMGLRADFVVGEWDGLLAGLETGRYDIMANGVDITPSRQEKYEFTTPYAYNYMVVVVRNDDARFNKMEDLKDMSTANTITSTYAQVAQSYGANVTPVDDLTQTIDLLVQGRIDATLNSELTIYDYLAEKPDTPIKIALKANDATEVAIPVTRTLDPTSFVDAMNQAIDALRQDGTLSAISMKYFGVDITAQN